MKSEIVGTLKKLEIPVNEDGQWYGLTVDIFVSGRELRANKELNSFEDLLASRLKAKLISIINAIDRGKDES